MIEMSQSVHFHGMIALHSMTVYLIVVRSLVFDFFCKIQTNVHIRMRYNNNFFPVQQQFFLKCKKSMTKCTRIRPRVWLQNHIPISSHFVHRRTFCTVESAPKNAPLYHQSLDSAMHCTYTFSRIFFSSTKCSPNS